MAINLTPCAGVTITANDLDTLIAVQGINAQGCVKFRDPKLLACDGIATMPPNGAGVAGVTQFVGADCKIYTLPAAPAAFDLCASLGALAAGTYTAGTTELVGADCKKYAIPSPCTILAAIPVGAQGVDNTDFYVGVDCQKHLLPAIPVKGIQFNGVTIAPNGAGIVNITNLDVNAVTDTSTVDLTLVGQAVSAAVIFDPVAGNLANNAGGAGIRVLCEDVQDCVAPMFAPWGVYNDAANLIALTPSSDVGNAFVLGTDGRPFVATAATFSFRVTTGTTAVPPAGGVVVNNGDALHFWSTSGVAFSVVAGSAIVQVDLTVSTDAGNAVTFGTDGKLFVPPAAANFITGILDTNSTDLTVTAGVLQSDVKISALANNGLSIQPDGLYVTQQGVTVTSPNLTVNSVVGGTWNHDLQLSVRVSTTAGNALTIDPSGLFVPATPTACSIGGVVAAQAAEPLPAKMVIIGASGCETTAIVNNYQTIFGNDGNQVQQDTRYFYNNDIGAFAAAGANPNPSGANSAVVGGTNGIASGLSATILGGLGNTSAGDYGAIIAGLNNTTATGGNGGSSVIIAGLNNNSGNAEWSLVSGQSNVLTGNGNGSPNRSVVGGFGNTLTGAAGDNAVFGVSNVINDGAHLNLVAGDQNNVSGFRDLVAGSQNTMTGSNGAAAVGFQNNVSGSGASAFGVGLISNSAAMNAVGAYNLNLPQAAVTTYIGTDYIHVVGNGDNQPAIERSNAWGIRKDGIQQWWITVDNNNNPNKLPQYPDNATAAAGLALSATTTNLFFGALAMVDVAGVPTWFKYDGTNWLFAF